MKVYVGGKFADKQKIRGYMDEIEKLGHTISHDWTSFKVKLDEDNIFMGNTSEDNMEESAKYDIKGVQECDVMVAILDDKQYPYQGTFTELGCALGLGKKIIVMCPEPDAECRTTCFFYHPTIIHVSYWGEVLDTFNMINIFE